mgnify:CR=1 FL=1
MAAFAAGETDLLVSTTVIEVGVDVPNAAVMVVENADRFGLSQLHQLRGRVGRGSHQSYCILISDNRNEETRARLKVMAKTTDGFRIAEEDLRLRGPGDFFGVRQHGLPGLKIADLGCDTQLLREAQEAADALLETGLHRVFISLGADGVFAADHSGQKRKLPALKGNIVSTTGCGDSFMAALTWAYLQGSDLEKSARAGRAASTVTMASAETISAAMSEQALLAHM